MGWRDFGRGSNVPSVLIDVKYAVIEAKSGATGAMIWKKDISQLAGSVNWRHLPRRGLGAEEGVLGGSRAARKTTTQQ